MLLPASARPEIEYADGRRTPLRIDDWLHVIPGDASILDRCQGHTLDVGSGPGRLTVALAERGIPALGIDITLPAVQLARSCGALALHRDVFATVPGTGRWARVLLADGNIGIGGDPDALLSRVAELLKPAGQALVEVEPPGAPLAREMVRLSHAGRFSSWFPWAVHRRRPDHRARPQRGPGGDRGVDRRGPLVRRAVPRPRARPAAVSWRDALND